MPAYSNLGIKLIDTGAEPAVWGISTNENLELFDSAVVGFTNVVLTIPGTSLSPNTLNVEDFSPSAGRNRLIQFSSDGDLGSSASVQITPNDFEGYYYIKNNLSSGRTILLFQGTYNSTRRYEIPNGKDVLVRCTGTGDTSSVLDVLNDLVTNSVYTGSLTTNTLTATSVTADTITASTTFSGPGTDIVGTANQLSVNSSTSSGVSTNAGSINITEDNTSTASNFITLVSANNGNRSPLVANGLKFTPSSGQLSATTVAGTTAVIQNTFQLNNLAAGEITVSGNIPLFNGTGAVDMPAGTSAQRPADPVVGMMRFNTDTGAYEVYTPSGWQNLATGAPPAGLGVGQTWTNLTGRAFDTFYQNTTGKPIMAMVVFTTNGQLASPASCRVIPNIGPTTASYSAVATVETTGIDPAGAVFLRKNSWVAVIPNTWWYFINKPPGIDGNNPNHSAIATWYELR